MMTWRGVQDNSPWFCDIDLTDHLEICSDTRLESLRSVLSKEVSLQQQMNRLIRGETESDIRPDSHGFRIIPRGCQDVKVFGCKCAVYD